MSTLGGKAMSRAMFRSGLIRQELRDRGMPDGWGAGGKIGAEEDWMRDNAGVVDHVARLVDLKMGQDEG